ncbi:MAG: capsular biosynthesis protein [Provencibacterium sp.]|nr:capsular biosynthesis protein [Provencibacterium sp.]
MDQPIDFVILWVDGEDKEWRHQRQRFQHTCAGEDDSEERYRDWGLLRYWFRGAEQFAPWVRKIHFVTCGHLPPWLNKKHPRLHIVKHEDYIPEEFLPTFSSHVIENHMHRIPGLAEHFVYFNDDMFILRPLRPSDFFKEGKPCDLLAFQPIVANPLSPVMPYIFLNNMSILCKYFNKRENVRKHWKNYFCFTYPPLYFVYNLLELFFPLYTGLYTVHGPSPFCKETFRDVWAREEEVLTQISANRFRSKNDTSQYLFREWQKLSGNFHPQNILKNLCYAEVQDDNARLIHAIETQKKKIICINDAPILKNPEAAQKELQMAFEKILPQPSAFEIE